MKADIKQQYDKIYKYCYFHVHNRVLAEDFTQETFLRYLDRMREEGSFIEEGDKLAYLYTIARNLCADYFRKNVREMLSFEEDGINTALDEKVLSEGRTPTSELVEQLALKQAVRSLPKDLQEVIWLRFVQEESAARVAKILNISRFCVYRREKQALKMLRERLEEGKL